MSSQAIKHNRRCRLSVSWEQSGTLTNKMKGLLIFLFFFYEEQISLDLHYYFNALKSYHLIRKPASVCLKPYQDFTISAQL